MKIRSILMGGAAALTMVGSALAADLPVAKAPYMNTGASPFNWTGFYLGVDAGYGFAAQDIGLSGNSANDLENPGSLGTNASGGVGGVHGGFNYQPVAGWVWGIEGRFAATGLRSSATDTNGNGLTTSLPWEGSVVGRLGIVPADPRLMLYGLAGVAFGELKQSATTESGSSFTSNDVHTGWTAGAGIEYAFTPALIGGLEYRYTNLGSHGICDPTTNGCKTFNASTTAAWNEVLARLSVKLY